MESLGAPPCKSQSWDQKCMLQRSPMYDSSLLLPRLQEGKEVSSKSISFFVQSGKHGTCALAHFLIVFFFFFSNPCLLTKPSIRPSACSPDISQSNLFKWKSNMSLRCSKSSWASHRSWNENSASCLAFRAGQAPASGPVSCLLPSLTWIQFIRDKIQF